MIVTIKWKSLDDAQLLSVFKDSLIKLGIEDNPTSSDYRELHVRGKSPSIYTLTQRFGSWERAVNLAGISYKSERGRKIKSDKRSNGSDKYFKGNTEEMMDLVIKIIKDNHITRWVDYENNRGEAPSLVTVTRRTGLTWNELKERAGTYEFTRHLTPKKVADIYDEVIKESYPGIFDDVKSKSRDKMNNYKKS